MQSEFNKHFFTGIGLLAITFIAAFVFADVAVARILAFDWAVLYIGGRFIKYVRNSNATLYASFVTVLLLVPFHYGIMPPLIAKLFVMVLVGAYYFGVYRVTRNPLIDDLTTVKQV